MTAKQRRRWSNLLLLAASCVLTLGLLEGGLRLVLDPEQLVPNEPSHPALNEKRNELRFYARNRDRPAESLGPHDPWLGWDASYGESRARGVDPVPVRSGPRAVALGDSFVFGNEVAPGENFVALLDRADNGLEVLNLGVPGYGIDQSWLKYERHGQPLEPEVVIFGIYVSDYERATVGFTAGAKPRYEARDSGVVLTNRPVPSPAASLTRIAHELAGRSWVLDFLGYRLAMLGHDPRSFFTDGDRIARHVLSCLADAVLPDRRLLIVHFPRGESFADPDPFHRAMNDRLLGLYRELELPFVNLTDEFLRRAAPADVARRFYVVRDSGSVGHLNPEGHRVAAEVIARALDLPRP